MERTGWISGKIAPVRVGVYERAMSHGNHNFHKKEPSEGSYRGYAFWDGKQWHGRAYAPEFAKPIGASGFQLSGESQWRGLASDPAVK